MTTRSTPNRPPLAAVPWPALSRRAAGIVVLGWCGVLLAVTLLAHPTPLYFVETDLVGEYLPAARELARGVIDPAHYSYRGPGYPAMLAAVTALVATLRQPRPAQRTHGGPRGRASLSLPARPPGEPFFPGETAAPPDRDFKTPRGFTPA